jgi:FixJ family two-component response regulator
VKSQHNVFVVDDDASARNGLARLMRAAGYHVYTYTSAKEFMATIHPKISGCVVLDIRMPRMSGIELAEKFIKYSQHLSIIFVTANDDPQIRKQANKMNAVGFFRKPVDGTALIDAINWSFKTTSKENND